jgi:hypothetical protein
MPLAIRNMLYYNKIILMNVKLKSRGMTVLGILICQECNEVIDYLDEEKVSKLYGKCTHCNEQ